MICYKAITATRYFCRSNFARRALGFVVNNHKLPIFLVEDKLAIGLLQPLIRLATYIEMTLFKHKEYEG